MTIYHDVTELSNTCVNEIIVIPVDVRLPTSSFVLINATKEDGSTVRLILATADTSSVYIQAEDVLAIRTEAHESGTVPFFTLAEERLLQKGKPIPLEPQEETVHVEARFLEYKDGDPLQDTCTGKNVIAHVTTPTKWGRRYGSILGSAYPEAKQAFKEQDMDLCSMCTVEVEDGRLWIATLACVREGNVLQPPALDVEALRNCLTQLGKFAQERELDVLIPMVGLKETGYGWGVIFPHVQRILCDVHRVRAFVYTWKKGVYKVRKGKVKIKAQV